MTTLTPPDPYRAVLEEQIRSRLTDRRWYRARPWTIGWPSREENEVVLRALVRIARAARAVAEPDPIDQYKAGRDRGMSYHDVQAEADAPWWVGRRDRDQLTGAYIPGTERRDPLTGKWS